MAEKRCPVENLIRFVLKFFNPLNCRLMANKLYSTSNFDSSIWLKKSR